MTNKKLQPTPTTVELAPDPALADSIDLLNSLNAEDSDQADPIDEPTEAAAPPVPAIEYVAVDPPAPSGVSVRFMQDYRGVLTDEAFYEKGSVIVFDADRATKLITQGRAVEVKIKAEE
ncbi:hypothetical protein [Herpetosiphon geysericola]|uniref:Uncharacterized protein n=1 Tax=Herpetosiphon geysericola TaxID=70996 RepID=A0A0N8GT06_9CHLR|nr:hypothetical protein [Herpetosiphon geysericola]KPL90762.1 hypothetical protein SE18_05190 [Herpetosiphon geysericola]